jgi:hypothetical protein
MLPIQKSKRTALRFPVVGIVLGVLFCWANCITPVLSAPVPDKQPAAKALEPIPFPGGVLDPDRRTAFVSSPKGGIQSIRLEDGKVLWTNDDISAKPWLATSKKLIARGERIVILDALNDGKVLKQCDAPAFPKVETPDRCIVSFNLWDPRVTGETLEAKWFAVANIDRSKGRPFAFEAWTAFNKAVPVGTVQFNLETGKAEVQTDPKPANVTIGLIPEAAKPDQQIPAGLPETLKTVWQQYHKDQNGRITVLGGRLVGVSMAVEQVGTEFTKRALLNSWDLKTGTAAEPVELVKEKALALANIVLTEDRAHAAVVFSTSSVIIYSLSDGKRVAEVVKGVSSPSNAFVDGMRLYSVESAGNRGEQSLRALDLKAGKLVWDHPVQPRNTMPLPP